MKLLNRVGGSAGIPYPVGAERTTSLEFSSAIPYPSKPPSLSSADRAFSNHVWHEGRAS